jgi:hypothetical protein
MKLEVGKKYVDRERSVWEILAQRGECFIALYNDNLPKVFNEYGCYIDGGSSGHPYDLIREYEEPARYSVDVWVKNKPFNKPLVPGDSLASVLLGDYGTWHLSSGLGTCPRHLRITVEEVGDDNR